MLQVQVGAFDRSECASRDKIREFADAHRVILAGGFFGGYADTIRTAHAKYHEVLDEHMERRIMDDDQLIWFDVWCRWPDLIRTITCPTPLIPFGLYCHVVGQQPCMTHRRYNCPAIMFAPDN